MGVAWFKSKGGTFAYSIPMLCCLLMWDKRFLHCIHAELFPIIAIGVDEVGNLLKSLECDGVLEGGVWRVGVEFIPVVDIVANKVGDCVEGLKQ